MDNFLPTYDEVVLYVYDQFSLAFDAPNLSLSELKNCCECSENRLKELNNVELLKPIGKASFKSFEAPVFFGSEGPHTLDSVKEGKLQFDVFLNAFLLMSGLQEWLCDSKDKQGRFPYYSSLQYKFGFVEIPAVTIYFELFAEIIRENGHGCSPIKFKNPVIFTHDIDQVRSGWFEELGYHLKYPSVKGVFLSLKAILGKIVGTNDAYYDALINMAKIDKDHSLRAISFLMTEKSAEDADYHLPKLQKATLENSQRIGLHPGFYTYNNKQNFAKQFEKLEALYPNSERIVRQHFLRYDVKKTIAIHEELGIKEDYSLGFAEQYGFRNSIATPFHLYCFDKKRSSSVLEIPLYFMDGTLHHYLNDSSENGKDKIVLKIKRLNQELNVSFSVLFHNSVFTEYKYKGFTAMYKKIIQVVVN